MLGVDLLDLVKRYKNYFCVYLLHNDGSLLTAYVTRTRFWVKEMPVSNPGRGCCCDSLRPGPVTSLVVLGSSLRSHGLVGEMH